VIHHNIVIEMSAANIAALANVIQAVIETDPAVQNIGSVIGVIQTVCNVVEQYNTAQSSSSQLTSSQKLTLALTCAGQVLDALKAADLVSDTLYTECQSIFGNSGLITNMINDIIAVWNAVAPNVTCGSWLTNLFCCTCLCQSSKATSNTVVQSTGAATAINTAAPVAIKMTDISVKA